MLNEMEAMMNRWSRQGVVPRFFGEIRNFVTNFRKDPSERLEDQATVRDWKSRYQESKELYTDVSLNAGLSLALPKAEMKVMGWDEYLAKQTALLFGGDMPDAIDGQKIKAIKFANFEVPNPNWDDQIDPGLYTPEQTLTLDLFNYKTKILIPHADKLGVSWDD